MKCRGCMNTRSWKEWLHGANAAIYSSHFLASWSTRMWAFSMGLFLISVSPQSLQLSGTYGLSLGAGLLLFGSLVGDWIDGTPRLRAATISMVLMNVLVAACACVVLAFLILLSKKESIVDWLRYLLYFIIVGLSVCSRLLKEARIIIVERDWIVEMCAKDEHQLAVMTSSFRRIDLLTKILAPIVTGQIMTFAGLKIGCGFVAVWSLVSLGVEYCLIRRVYNIVPALQVVKHATGRACAYKVQPALDEGAFFITEDNNQPAADENKEPSMNTADASRRIGQYCLCRCLGTLLVLYRGLRTYFRYPTKWSGLAYACLYLTVLTLGGGVTVGFATTQGLSGSVLGILTGVGAGFGTFATFTYPYIVKKLGLPATGVLALGLQVTCLTLCVISVWLPGSPFDLSFSHDNQTSNKTITNSTQDLNGIIQQNRTGCMNDTRLMETIINTTSSVYDVADSKTNSYLSVWILMTGIVLSRFGLWTADLTVAQLFLETVAPQERGIVNGFQSSLNQLLNFIKFSLVIIIPHPNQFGLLVFISYTSICTAWMFMGVYAYKANRIRAKGGKNRDKSKCLDIRKPIEFRAKLSGPLEF